VNYFLLPSSGQANDAICKWLYDIHWNAAHPTTPPTASVVITNSSSPSSPPPASLFLLHLVPVLVFSFLYRTARSLPVPGIAAVLLGIYNAQKAQQPPPPKGKFIDPSTLVSTVYGAPALTLPPPPSPAPIANHVLLVGPGRNVNIQLSAGAGAGGTSPRAAGGGSGGLSPSSSSSLVGSSLPVISDLNGSNVLVLVHVVLSWYLLHISAVSLLSQQQFCYLCAILCDNHSEGEIHRTLKEFVFQWTADWEQQMVTGGKKHVKVKVKRQLDDGEEEQEDGEKNGPRYVLTVSLLQDLLVGLTYCACYPGTKSLSLLSLRAIHCRAVEELMPHVLLQTTAILESVDE